MRIIMHIDLDAFYASVEERDRPELKGKPVVVGADPKAGKGRGVVSTANYEARKFGLRSGMPISIAYRKCPECIFLPVDMPKYIKTSMNIMSFFRKYAENFEQTSIDECFLDVSTRCKNYACAIKLAEEIQQKLKTREGLSCSIGIGPNKLIAKIASDYKKPAGITVVKPKDVLRFLAPLDVGKLLGVGPKTKGVLNSLGIRTIYDLRKVSKENLIKIFGKFGSVLYDEARGVDNRPVAEKWEVKSIGHQVTFEKDTRSKKKILETLVNIVNKTIARARSQKLAYKTITIKIRYEDFFTTSRAKTLSEYHRNEKTAQLWARKLLLPFLEDRRKVRLIGFSISKLKQNL